MKTIVIAETRKGAETLCSGARSFAGSVELVTFGEPVCGIADVCKVVKLPNGVAVECAADTVAPVVEGAQTVLIENTRRCLVLGGRLAAKVGASLITNVACFDGKIAQSMYFGGIANKKSKPLSEIAFYSVAAGVFDGLDCSGTDVVEEVEYVIPAYSVEIIETEALPESDVDLTSAKIIVGVGRGFSAEQDLELARDLASKIGAEVGCSRPISEGEGWMPRETYIGVSGLMLKPSLYVGIGISGQQQHMVGIDAADTIIAINKDKNAPIFKQCDLGFVGDIKDVLPALNAAL